MSPRTRSGSSSAARVIAVVADILAFIIILWILMYLLDANRGNDFVQWVHDAARWLAGWSLGGMLATQLAARRGDNCPGLMTLCSNPCFRSRDDWAAAMPAEVFDAFEEAFRLGPQDTLKRFSLLCSRGAYDPRTLARQLQVSLLDQPQAIASAGLRLLAELDGRAALQRYVGPQLHLFAGGDALVPASAAEALLAWLPDVEVDVLANASHGLPLERAEDVATAMLAFMDEGEDD